MRNAFAVLLVYGCCLAGSACAWAQNPVGFNTPFGGRSDNPVGPTVSPYLNLLQSNSQGLIPYQTLVRPMIDDRDAIQRQGAALNRLQQQVYTGQPAGGLHGTGHSTYFMNYSHFYPNPRTR